MGRARATVAVVRCLSYEPSATQQAVDRVLMLAGGPERFIRPGWRVLIKPNLIVPVGPDIPAQTHPELICAVAEWVRQAGAIPMVGDSPAWGNVRGCLAALGIEKRLGYMGVEMIQLGRPVRIQVDGVSVGISRAALEVDAIINLPKLKAHQQLGATFAFKNMYGCVAGKEKALRHYTQGRCCETFSRMLVGIYRQLAPAVNLIDGITAMEGPGPIRGGARSLGVLVAGKDPAACERICCRLVNMDPASLPILQAAKAMDVGCHDEAAIDCVGDDWRDLVCADFVQAQRVPLRFSLGRICKSALRQAVLLTGQRIDTWRRR